MWSRGKLVVFICGIFFLPLAPVLTYAQSAAELSQVRKLYVASFGEDAPATSARNALLRRLQKSSTFHIVPAPTDADAVLKGTARIWSVGRVSLSPHSHSAVETVVEGFLSVELVGRDKQTLWSYLVTPSRFHWNGITDDLAEQIVNRLVGATKETPSPQPRAEGSSTNALTTIKGAGGTFPAPLYQKWFESFQEGHPSVHISYDPVGSSEGIEALRKGQVDFAASDMPLSDQAASGFHGGVRQIPMVLGAVVPIYNVKGLRQNLNFTPEILAGIYLGKIMRWNDPAIKKANSSVSLPDVSIVPVHRSDGSGTTFVWSEYLAKVSAEWKNSVGSGATVKWPVGIGAERNEGVASTVQQTPNSIGYVEFVYALQHELSFGAVKNPSGQFVKADISSVMAAARASQNPDAGFRASLTASPGKSAYPISTYTWLLLPASVTDNNKRIVAAELLRWALTSGQRICSVLGYAPLPADVADRALHSVDEIH